MSHPPVETDQPVAAASRQFQFRLVHICYIFTLLATALAIFGPGGIVICVFVAVYWAAVFTSRARPAAFRSSCLILLVGLGFIAAVLPAATSSGRAARRGQGVMNMRQIGVALNNYHNDHGTFPPAYLADKNGKPQHSWRVLILPYLAERALYEEYNFDEPWNGPNNSKLLDRMPPMYRYPSPFRDTKERTGACFVAVVGPETAWPGKTARKFADLRDAMYQTALLIEYDNESIPWLEPRDLEMDEALELLASGKPTGYYHSENFFYQDFVGRSVLFADGSTRTFDRGGSQSVWSAMLGVNDGVGWDPGDLDGPSTNASRLRVANCLRLAMLVLLTFFPLPWVWLNPTPTARPLATGGPE